MSTVLDPLSDQPPEEAGGAARALETPPTFLALWKVAEALNRAKTLKQICRVAVGGLRSGLNAGGAAVSLFDEDGVLRIKAWQGFSAGYRRHFTGYCPWPRESGHPGIIFVDDVNDAPDLAELRPVLAGQSIHAMAFVPLCSRNELLGTFIINYDAPHRFLTEDALIAKTLAAQIAFAVERTRAEQTQSRLLGEVRAQRERLDAIVATVPGIVWEARMGLGGSLPKLTFVSEHVERVLGYRRAVLLRKRDGWLKTVHPEARAALLRELRKLRANGEGGVMEVRCRAKDGRAVWIESSVKISRGDEEGSIGLRGVAVDITRRKAVETELAQELALRRAIEGSMPSGIAAVDLSGRQSYVNPALCRMLGFTPDELIGREPPFPYWAPHQAAFIQQAFDETLRGNLQHGGFEFRFRRKNGEEFDALVVISPLTDGAGRTTGWLASVSDITEQKRAREELAYSKDRIAGILKSITEAFMVVDREWRVTYVNERAARQAGLPAEQIIGRRFWDVFPWAANSEFDVQYHRAMDEHVPVQFQTYDTYSNSWLEAHADPTEEGLSAYILDVTERKKAELAIRESEERLKLAMEAGRMGTWEWNLASGTMQWSSQLEELHGLAPGSFEGTFEACQHKIHPDDRERVLQSIRRAVASGGQYLNEYRIVRADGRVLWLEARGRLLLDQDGQPARLAGVCMDVTDRKLAEDELVRQAAELARSNADLQQFAYVTSHDLQEPLRTISSFVQLLSQRYRGKLDSDADEYIGFVVSGVQRMSSLISDLLSYSRLVNTTNGTSTPVDLQGVVAWASSNLRSIVEESGAEITHDPLPHVPGDHVQLVQLMQNLLSNAIKYRGPDAVRVHITAERNPRGWTIRVADNGIGIDPAYHERIFGLFKRLHSREVPGTGIGLAICRKIVEKHGGQIWVESAAGQGAIFCFTLPAE
jgi:PAS domain S-box-containing protein